MQVLPNNILEAVARDQITNVQLEAAELLEGLFPARSKEGKHIGGMKQQTHLHPPELKSPPFGIHELYPYPQTLRPSPRTHKKGHVFEDAERRPLEWPHNHSWGRTLLGSVPSYALALSCQELSDQQ